MERFLTSLLNEWFVFLRELANPFVQRGLGRVATRILSSAPRRSRGLMKAAEACAFGKDHTPESGLTTFYALRGVRNLNPTSA